jgi:hypothetical protein
MSHVTSAAGRSWRLKDSAPIVFSRFGERVLLENIADVVILQGEPDHVRLGAASMARR